MTMLECVALAIYAEIPTSRKNCMAAAQAAVKAMREPTEEIIALGGDGPWQAFIDSILATQPQEQER